MGELIERQNGTMDGGLYSVTFVCGAVGPVFIQIVPQNR